MELNTITESMLTSIRSASNHVLYDTHIQWYRRNNSDNQPEWIPFDMNETYIEAIQQYPEDYRWSHRILYNIDSIKKGNWITLKELEKQLDERRRLEAQWMKDKENAEFMDKVISRLVGDHIKHAANRKPGDESKSNLAMSLKPATGGRPDIRLKDEMQSAIDAIGKEGVLKMIEELSEHRKEYDFPDVKMYWGTDGETTYQMPTTFEDIMKRGYANRIVSAIPTICDCSKKLNACDGECSYTGQ